MLFRKIWELNYSSLRNFSFSLIYVQTTYKVCAVENFAIHTNLSLCLPTNSPRSSYVTRRKKLVMSALSALLPTKWDITLSPGLFFLKCLAQLATIAVFPQPRSPTRAKMEGVFGRFGSLVNRSHDTRDCCLNYQR